MHRMFMIEDSWTSVCLMSHQNESMSMDRKMMIEDSWDRNMISRSNMDYQIYHIRKRQWVYIESSRSKNIEIFSQKYVRLVKYGLLYGCCKISRMKDYVLKFHEQWFLGQKYALLYSWNQETISMYWMFII